MDTSVGTTAVDVMAIPSSHGGSTQPISARSWMVISEQASAVVAVVFAAISILYANAVSRGGTLRPGDHTRMAISGAAAMGMVTMTVVAMALHHRNRTALGTAAAQPTDARLSWPAVGLVVIGFIVTVFQVLLWTTS